MNMNNSNDLDDLNKREETLLRIQADIWNLSTKSLLVFHYTKENPLFIYQGFHSIISMHEPTLWYGCINRYFPNALRTEANIESWYYLGSTTHYEAEQLDVIKLTNTMSLTMDLLRKYYKEGLSD